MNSLEAHYVKDYCGKLGFLSNFLEIPEDRSFEVTLRHFKDDHEYSFNFDRFSFKYITNRIDQIARIHYAHHPIEEIENVVNNNYQKTKKFYDKVDMKKFFFRKRRLLNPARSR